METLHNTPYIHLEKGGKKLDFLFHYLDEEENTLYFSYAGQFYRHQLSNEDFSELDMSMHEENLAYGYNYQIEMLNQSEFAYLLACVALYWKTAKPIFEVENLLDLHVLLENRLDKTFHRFASVA
jgi:hypothetical protein